MVNNRKYPDIYECLYDFFLTDNNTKMWSFNLIDYSLLHNQINSLKPYVIIGNIPKAVLNLCSSPPKLAEPICLESIEPALSSKLMSFQKDGVW